MRYDSLADFPIRRSPYYPWRTALRSEADASGPGHTRLSTSRGQKIVIPGGASGQLLGTVQRTSGAPVPEYGTLAPPPST